MSKKAQKGHEIFVSLLMNSPVTFQAMMDDIFRDMIDGCIIIIYMDDIFLFAKDIPTLTKN
jgi:hypothetical protein